MKALEHVRLLDTAIKRAVTYQPWTNMSANLVTQTLCKASPHLRALDFNHLEIVFANTAIWA